MKARANLRELTRGMCRCEFHLHRVPRTDTPRLNITPLSLVSAVRDTMMTSSFQMLWQNCQLTFRDASSVVSKEKYCRVKNKRTQLDEAIHVFQREGHVKFDEPQARQSRCAL